MNDVLKLGKFSFNSRFILGSGKYAHELIDAAINEAKAEIITLAMRRVGESNERNILDFIPKNITLLPNTSGARTADEAVRIARLGRELGCGDFVKIEVIRDSKYLFPDNAQTIKATEILAKEGFIVMPYMYPELAAARAMLDCGAVCVMPLAAPIGSNAGLAFKAAIEIMINELDAPVIIDAGLGTPAQACEAMQMGAAAVMANTAIATAGNIRLMARAFGDAVRAGRAGYLAGIGRVRDVVSGGEASSPLTGFLGE